MDDIFSLVRDGNALQVRIWLDNTENDLNQGFVHVLTGLFSPILQFWLCHILWCGVATVCLVIFSVKIHVKLSHQLAICRENVQYNRV